MVSDSTLPVNFISMFPASPSQYSSPNNPFFEFTVAVAVFVSPDPNTLSLAADIGLFATANSEPITLSYLEVQKGVSGAFRPLQPVALPPEWQSDKACVVTTDLVASDGPIITVETVSASCEDFGETFCDAGSCSGQVGREYKTIDPGALGG